MPDVATRADAPLKHGRPAGLVAAVAAVAAAAPASALGDTPVVVTASASAVVMADVTEDRRSPAERPAPDWDGLVSLALGYLETTEHRDHAAPREPEPVPST